MILKKHSVTFEMSFKTHRILNFLLVFLGRFLNQMRKFIIRKCFEQHSWETFAFCFFPHRLKSVDMFAEIQAFLTLSERIQYVHFSLPASDFVSFGK